MANTEIAQCDETHTLNITVGEYKSLIASSLRGSMLADAMLNAAYLSYDNRLSISGDKFDSLLRAIDPQGYSARFSELQAKEARE